MNKVIYYMAELVQSQLKGTVPSKMALSSSEMELLLKLATEHYIELMIGSALLLVEEESPLRQKIKNVIIGETIFAKCQEQEAAELSKVFEREHIKFQILKGHILRKSYPKPEMRKMSDIDLIIDQKDISRTGTILKERGYLYEGLSSNHDIYRKNSIMLEVHYTLFNKKCSNSLGQYFGCFEHSQLQQGSRYCYEFNVNDFYIYMIAHMAKHFYQNGCGIRGLIDIQVYLNKNRAMMDNTYIHKTLSYCGLAYFEKEMKLISDKWLHHKRMSHKEAMIFNYMVDSGVYGNTENYIVKRYLDKKNHKVNKISFTLWYLFPDLRYMRNNYPILINHKVLLPTCWIIRLISSIKKISYKLHRFHQMNAQELDSVNSMKEDLHLHLESKIDS